MIGTLSPPMCMYYTHTNYNNFFILLKKRPPSQKKGSRIPFENSLVWSMTTTPLMHSGSYPFLKMPQWDGNGNNSVIIILK